MVKILSALCFLVLVAGCSESRSLDTDHTQAFKHSEDEEQICRDSTACRQWCQNLHNCASACANYPKGECTIIKAQCENQVAGCYNRRADEVMVQKEKADTRVPAQIQKSKK